METIKKYKLQNIIQVLVVISIGLVLVAWPGASYDILTKALAILIVLIGTACIIFYFVKKERTFLSYSELTIGILIAALGTWIFSNSEIFITFIPKLFGTFIVASGIGNLGQTITMIKNKFSVWWIAFLISILTLLLGAYLLLDSEEANSVAITLIGVFLIIDGVTNLLTMIMVIIATDPNRQLKTPVYTSYYEDKSESEHKKEKRFHIMSREEQEYWLADDSNEASKGDEKSLSETLVESIFSLGHNYDSSDGYEDNYDIDADDTGDSGTDEDK